ncbi:MAG: zinc-ribbon domain-containing protein [Treponema sp.]|nr:zinc-ribbon domain-containing protein [Treponema sp.]
MTCSNCGTELKDDYKFCLKCGTPVVRPVLDSREDCPAISGEECDASIGTGNSSSIKASMPDMDVLEEKLSKLHELFIKELIDADEYKKAKAKLLGI